MKFPVRLRWVWLSLGIVFLDRATKAWIESQTTTTWRHEVVHNLVYLVHSSNPGIAFSIFANSASPWLRYLLILGAVAIIGVIAWLLVAGSNLGRLNAAGLALLLGGATGNLTDRILHGAVPTLSKYSSARTGGRRLTLPIRLSRLVQFSSFLMYYSPDNTISLLINDFLQFITRRRSAMTSRIPFGITRREFMGGMIGALGISTLPATARGLGL